jgi:hypothetical protein
MFKLLARHYLPFFFSFFLEKAVNELSIAKRIAETERKSLANLTELRE